MMCLRAPDVFIYGRFWAEEGDVFFHNAWTMPPLQALFHSFGGYLNLPTNAVTLVARWLIPLEYAPYFTTIVGLLFQLLPLFLLLSAKDEWLNSFKTRLFLTLLLLFVPETLETSLQSLHIQFQLTLAAAIILVLQPNYSYQRWLKLLVLMFAGLSGLMNFALIPIYAVRCWLDKDKLRIEEFIALSISCCVQYFFFYEKIESRFHSFNLFDFSTIFFAHELYIPFGGINRFTVPYIDYLHDNMHNIKAVIIPFTVTILFIAGVLWIFHAYVKTRPAIFLFASALALFCISVIGSIGDRSGFLTLFTNQRYLFISQSILCITLVYITNQLHHLSQKIGRAVICWLILVGGIHYFAHPTFIIKAPANCLPWQQQVELWKRNPSYNFQLWPDWVHMTLTHHDDKK
ncbi:hypothetical protein [Commensalibacter oyaizuii]|uniref:Glycosyltransferase RgtA/B/C/D-like domain-containing protein n=1 Tax=Commensalibacter oyaizuii TaxID=3043873 RepID=A0ABT6PZI7_9PROT|nr:hypothetical protein [Commensalibacter sp. TBRC 16381]MDI2090130.1 hypothetical protein [Commensalibacter sp. TBRC 16381]